MNDWVNKTEINDCKRPGVSSEMAERMKAWERENRDLREANGVLRKASANLAMAEFDRRVEVMIEFIDAHRDAHGVEPT